ILVEVSCDLAHRSRRTPRLQQAGRAVILVCSVVDDVALIDVAGARELFATRTNVDVALLVEDEVGSAESVIVARRLVPHGTCGVILRSTSALSSLTAP